MKAGFFPLFIKRKVLHITSSIQKFTLIALLQIKKKKNCLVIIFLKKTKGIPDSMIGSFKLTNEEYNIMARTSNKESKYIVENMGIVFNTFEFLKFLSGKIQQHVL